MLPDLHDSLRRLIWERGQISPDEVDITFEAPTRERIERTLRPTLNLFLFDMRENFDLRQSNFPVSRSNGHAERRMSPRRIDLRFMISALTTAIEDEHALLWRALVTLLKHSHVPDELLPAAARALDVPITASVCQVDEGARLLDVWTALDVPPRAALYYVVTVPVDLDVAITAPLVLTRTTRYRRATSDDATTETRVHIGGVVRDRAGAPLVDVRVALAESAADGSVTDADGRYTLRDVPAGALTVRISLADGTERTAHFEVPGSTYDLVADDTPTAAAAAARSGRETRRQKSAET